MRRFCSIISICRGNRNPYPGSIDRVDSEKWIRRWGLKAKSWRGMFPFRRWLMWNDFFLRVKFLSFPPCLFLPLYKCYQQNIRSWNWSFENNIGFKYFSYLFRIRDHRKLFIFYLFKRDVMLKKELLIRGIIEWLLERSYRNLEWKRFS